jgi:octaprenyl-diphosphate synthase
MQRAMSQTKLEDRLCHTLVADTLRDSQVELLGVKAVRFLADYPWKIGKQLRPITFLLAARSVRLSVSREPPNDPREVRLAAAIELLHEASLVHDDLVDRSELRRGVPTVHMHSGQGMALLIGDYMVFRGLKMILDCAKTLNDIAIAQQLADAGLAIAHGEAEQLDRVMNRTTLESRMSMDEYLGIIAKKTAAFFAGCAEAGAAAAGASEGLRRVYREFGMAMGIAFQMVDDLIDVYGDGERAQKTLRNNANEGTITLPMIRAYELSPQDPAWEPLVRGDQDAAFDGLAKLLSDPRVRERCTQDARDAIASARSWLEKMPSNIYRLGLYDLLDFVSTGPWGGLNDAHSNAQQVSQPEGNENE